MEYRAWEKLKFAIPVKFESRESSRLPTAPLWKVRENGSTNPERTGEQGRTALGRERDSQPCLAFSLKGPATSFGRLWVLSQNPNGLKFSPKFLRVHKSCRTPTEIQGQNDYLKRRQLVYWYKLPSDIRRKRIYDWNKCLPFLLMVHYIHQEVLI